MENPGPGVKPVSNQTMNSTSRTTRGGKTYSYHLTVVQQPSRARACGAGAKASADRRPVDPPPIVELQIFEVIDNVQHDITFTINANYFLFATLEQARKQAQPRGMPAERPSTVLTGTPVAGMVCLERPKRAGYFIFPDLSVRHEGAYRLSFSLFEDLREPNDEDNAEDVGKQSVVGSDGHATNRLEVKSAPFTVYSAKKFPGLTESTPLSRTVAEQGCRVRIRRDVRMRKRQSKGGGKEWDGYEEATAEERARMSATPEASNYGVPTSHGYEPVPRPRSGSNASYHSLAPSAHPSRRTSMQEMHQGYHEAGFGTSPHTPHTNYPQTSPYGQQQSQTYPQPPFMQQQSAMQPPQPQYVQPSSYPQRPSVVAAPPAPAQQGFYGYQQAAPPPMPQHTAPHSQWSQPHQQHQQTYEPQEPQHRSSMDYQMNYSHDHHHRSSSQYSAPPSAISADYNTSRNVQEPFQSHPGSQSYQQTQAPASHPQYHSPSGSMDKYNHAHRPAPLEPVQPPTRTTGATTPLPLSNRPFFTNNQLPPLNTVNITAAKPLEPTSPANLVPHSATGYSYNNSGLTHADAQNKRNYSQVFSNRHQQEPLRHGARPGTPANHYALSPNDVDDGLDGNLQGMEPLNYRRANGHVTNRLSEQQQVPHFMAAEDRR